MKHPPPLDVVVLGGIAFCSALPRLARQGMVIAIPATSNQGAELWFTQFRDY